MEELRRLTSERGRNRESFRMLFKDATNTLVTCRHLRSCRLHSHPVTIKKENDVAIFYLSLAHHLK